MLILKQGSSLSGIGNLNLCWASCLGHMTFLFTKTCLMGIHETRTKLKIFVFITII